jgi:hypothetical protein
MENQDIPIVEAEVVRGWSLRSVIYLVDPCPYCGAPHRHLKAPDPDDLIREADCLRGLYRLRLVD